MQFLIISFVFFMLFLLSLIHFFNSFAVKGWIRKGKILQGMQQQSKAVAAYQKALELDPSNAVSVNLFEFYIKCKSYHFEKFIYLFIFFQVIACILLSY